MIKITCDFCGRGSKRDNDGRIYEIYELIEAVEGDDDDFVGCHVCNKCLCTMNHGHLYRQYDTEDKGE